MAADPVAQDIVSRLSAAALSPQVMSDITKHAVDVHKQVLESLKAPSEIEKNTSLAGYYRSETAFKDYQRSAQGIADQIAVRQAGARAEGEERRKLETFKLELEKGSAAELKGLQAPSILQWITSMKDMGDIASFYGRNNLEKLLAAGLQYRAHVDARNDAKSSMQWQKEATLLAGIDGKIAALKTLPSQAEWAAAEQGAQSKDEKVAAASKRKLQSWTLAGISGPRGTDQEASIKNLQAQADALAIRVYGPAYKTLRDAEEAAKNRPIRDVTPPNAGAKPGEITSSRSATSRGVTGSYTAPRPVANTNVLNQALPSALSDADINQGLNNWGVLGEEVPQWLKDHFNSRTIRPGGGA